MSEQIVPMTVKEENAAIKPDTFKSATYGELFSEANAIDYLMMTLGTLGALGTGASLPSFLVLFGQMLDRLNSSNGNVQSTVNYVVILFLIVGCGNIVVSFILVVC
jgi:ATP-binding cassette subfamily B (MDR/TAP) protein 1